MDCQHYLMRKGENMEKSLETNFSEHLIEEYKKYYNKGWETGVKGCYEYLIKCSDSLNFGNSTPKEVVRGLAEIMKESFHNVGNL